MPTEAEILQSIMSQRPVVDHEATEGEPVGLLPEAEDEIEETPEGGAIIRFDEEAPADESDFYDNLAETLPDLDLSDLSIQLVDLVSKDREARKRRDEQYEEGLRRTGLGDDAPGGATFEGASKVVHPLLVEACVDFAARAIKELFPPAGPVKDSIPGEVTPEKLEKAKRKTRYMNWQFTTRIPEFRAELEQLLTQVPMGGVQYLKITWDGQRRRPVAEFVPVDDMFLPFAATNFYASDRKTHRQYLTRYEYERRVRVGMYRDVDLTTPMAPDVSRAESANQKIEGKEENSYNEDGLREVLEISVYYDLDDPKKPEGPAPYLVTIDSSTHRVLSVYRNWAENDPTTEELLWAVEFPFVPWRGAYAIGLPHMIGGLSAGATGALRALLDSALINNFPGMIKLKSQIGGQTARIDATQVNEVDGGLAVDDVRKVAMPVPANPPSAVLFQLLGFLVQAGKDVVRTTLDEAQNNQNVPVGTTMARIEQGLIVFSSIHARLHEAMKRVLGIVHRLDATYLTNAQIKEETGELMARREDFDDPIDVIPVSDPNIFSDMQRFAQVQALAGRSQLLPMLYDQRKVEEAILERMRFGDPKQYLIPKPEPTEMNAVNENVAASLGRPITAYPLQDHLAHLQVHLDFLSSPMLGSGVLMAVKFVPIMNRHIAEHIGLWYASEIHRIAREAAGQDLAEFQKSKDPEVKRKFDVLLAAASQRVLEQVPQTFGKVPQVLAQAMQVMQKLSPPQMQDPTQAAAAAAMAETQRKSAADQVNQQFKVVQLKERQQESAQKQAAKQSSDAQRIASEERQTAAELSTRQEIAASREATDVHIANLGADAKLKANADDNVTALEIAQMEVESGRKIAIENGGGTGE